MSRDVSCENRMGEPRSFSVCQECGAWRETGSGLISVLNDYDMVFFVEHHAAKCPVTGQPSAIVAICEDEPGFRPLPREKMWRPEDYPGYRPQREPSFTRYTTDLQHRLTGVWDTNDFGSMGGERLVLWLDGRAVMEIWNVTYCGHSSFRWSLDGQEHVCFGDPDEGAFPHCFSTPRPYFEVGRFTARTGEEMDVLRIYERGRDEEPYELFKADEPIENYRTPNQKSS